MNLFQRIAIANRGEIAVRIVRACREMGIRSLLLCAEVDRDSLAARLSDEVYVMRGLAPRAAYLDVDEVVRAACESGADALHPGYGFLSENATLSAACEDAGLVFIGPSPDHIRILGDKNRAREVMASNGVPVVPGSQAPLRDADDAIVQARRLGYPVLLKASKGGGGRGMRRLTSEREMATAFQAARSEAQTAFGSPDVYLERYIERPRHVEVQVAADRHGHAVHLFERECSVQRRFQKMIEEAPSPFLDEDTRRRMGEAAVCGARGIGYHNLGTFEFLLDGRRNFYFLEVNTRLQVEHPVTEEITGVDMVQLQIQLAAGAPLPFRQEDLSHRGWAFEARITCEDPMKDFLPGPGRVTRLDVPGGPGVRVDTGIFAGGEIPPYFDSLVAKLVVRGATREEARTRMLRALDEIRIDGIPTTIPFHRWAFGLEAFSRGELSTHFLEEQHWQGAGTPAAVAPGAAAPSSLPSARVLAAAITAIELAAARESPPPASPSLPSLESFPDPAAPEQAVHSGRISRPPRVGGGTVQAGQDAADRWKGAGRARP